MAACSASASWSVMSDSQIVLDEVCQVIRMQPFRRGRTLISILGFLIGMILVLASDGVCIAGFLFKEKHQCGLCDANERLAFWDHPKVLIILPHEIAGLATAMDVGNALNSAAAYLLVSFIGSDNSDASAGYVLERLGQIEVVGFAPGELVLASVQLAHHLEVRCNGVLKPLEHGGLDSRAPWLSFFDLVRKVLHAVDCCGAHRGKQLILGVLRELLRESEELLHGKDQVAVPALLLRPHAYQAEIDLDGVLENLEVLFGELSPAVVRPRWNLRPSWLVLFCALLFRFHGNKKAARRRLDVEL